MYVRSFVLFEVFASIVFALGPACITSLDCSLNGECVDGFCNCSPPWAGVACETMRFKPAKALQGYGMHPNFSSWGGGVLFDGHRYHLYANVITNGCLLSDWIQNSRIDHAISDTPEGPYEFQDVAINTWSHNPAPVRLRDGSFAIFHSGEGTGVSDGGENCLSSTFDGDQHNRKIFDIEYSDNWKNLAATRFNAFAELHGIMAADWEMKTLDKSKRAVANPDVVSRTQFPLRIVLARKVQNGSTIHVSSSLNGPWMPLLGLNTLSSCSNPAPWVHTNGSIFVVCDKVLKRAEHIGGPWSVVNTIALEHGPKGIYEDPFLYMDTRGFHIVYHVYDSEQRDHCASSTVSAHAFSKDGHLWHVSPSQPFGTQIEFQGLGKLTLSTRERPHIFFDAFGRMTHLVSAVCNAPECHELAPCVNCKYAYWDYTLVQPFDFTPLPQKTGETLCPGYHDEDCSETPWSSEAKYKSADRSGASLPPQLSDYARYVGDVTRPSLDIRNLIAQQGPLAIYDITRFRDS